MAKSGKIVLDASVIVKWYVQEEYTDKALKILENYSSGEVDIISVQLMPFEVLNSLRYDPELAIHDLVKIGESLSKLQIALYPVLDGLYEDAIRIAAEFGTTIYDSSYLSLARRTDCVLYTADDKFSKKIGKNDRLALLSGM